MSLAVACEDARLLPDDERLRRFAAALDELKKRVEAQIGEEDLRWIRKVDTFSRASEIVGRVLIHVSLDPVTWSAGVLALWLHKQLQTTEVGHTVLHGAFDRLEGAGRFNSKTWYWDVPIDEEAWHEGHNLKHHGFTNIAGKDPDVRFGPVRLTEHTPYMAFHANQVLFTVGFLFPFFTTTMNAHFTGLNDVLYGKGETGAYDVIEKRDFATIRKVVWKAFRKYVPYFAKEVALFPLLAGPFWWKVLLGNLTAEVLRNVYSAATIYCGHVGEDIAGYPEGTHARGKGQWYAMQVESTQNFDVPFPVSILCGALDRQIEHHLFPRFPTNRLRQISPEVQKICEEHGVKYHSGSWRKVLGNVFRRLTSLSQPLPVPA